MHSYIHTYMTAIFHIFKAEGKSLKSHSSIVCVLGDRGQKNSLLNVDYKTQDMLTFAERKPNCVGVKRCFLHR